MFFYFLFSVISEVTSFAITPVDRQRTLYFNTQGFVQQHSSSRAKSIYFFSLSTSGDLPLRDDTLHIDNTPRVVHNFYFHMYILLYSLLIGIQYSYLTLLLRFIFVFKGDHKIHDHSMIYKEYIFGTPCLYVGRRNTMCIARESF